MLKKTLKRILQFVAIILLAFFIIATIAVGMLGGSFVKIMEKAPEINPESMLLELNENSKIVDMNDNLIEDIASEEYREIVKYDDIPKHLVDAFVSVEDERFWTHNGIDLRGIVKSTLDNIAAGDIVRGASTIDQQLVRNMYLSSDVQWERKIMEMYLALEVDAKLSKEDIIEAYMNRVYLGQHAYGVEAGSQTYFSKPVKDLTVAEAASLASIVKGPSIYSLFSTYAPTDVPEGAKVIGEYAIAGENFKAVINDLPFERKNIVLAKMHELGKLSDEEYEKAKNEDVASKVKPGSKKQMEYSSNISDLIKKQTVTKLMEVKNLTREQALNMLYNGGLTIKTTIDWDMQKELEGVYDNFSNIFADKNYSGSPLLLNWRLNEYGNVIDDSGNTIYYKKQNIIDEDYNVYVPNGYYSIDENNNLTINSQRLKAYSDYIEISNYYSINEENNLVTYRTGNIVVKADLLKNNKDGSFTIKSDFFKNIEDFYSIVDGDLVINNKYYSIEKNGTVQPQSSTVIIDHNNGDIKALVGARGNSKDDTINRAVNFHRQPGSSIKPLAVYTPALDNNYTLASSLDDIPFYDGQGKQWPKNVYEGFKGISTLKQALVESRNTTAVSVLNDLGIETSMKYLERFGLINPKDPENDTIVTSKEDPSSNDENLSLALGGLTRGSTTLDMASAYAGLANKGERIESLVIKTIKSNKEGLIYDDNKNKTRVVSPEVAYLMTKALVATVDDQFTSPAKNPYDIQTAGKTGTTDNAMDFWFAGYTPYYTAASWIGVDNGNIRLSGYSDQVARLFGAYSKIIHEGLEAKNFDKPKGIVTREVCAISGQIPTDLCRLDPRGSQVIVEEFDEKTVPTKECEMHVSVTLDKRNYLLAKQGTPSGLLVNAVRVQRLKPYIPSANNNIVPADWKFEVPTMYSNLPTHLGPETIKNSDGSTTVRQYLADGTKIETTSYPDGTIITKVTDPNGKVTTTVKEPENTPEEPEVDDNTNVDDQNNNSEGNNSTNENNNQ